MISAVVISFNEAEKLENCLKSIENFADELVVIDLGSSDNSIKIAKKFKAKIYHHEFVPYVESVRNFAISKTGGEWVLILDPDEALTSNLKEKLKEIVKENKYDAINIPRKNTFFGRWIAHTNWWPDYHVRFFKKGRVEWTGEIHIYPKAHGKTLKLPENENMAIIHYGYDNIKEFIDRQSRYSSIEADQRYKKGERFSWINFFWWPTREFLVRYIKHSGFLDGFYGFALTFLMGVFRLMVAIKIWELEKQKA